MVKLSPQRWRKNGFESSIGSVLRRLLGVALVVAAIPSSAAAAAPVTVLGPGHRVVVRNDPYLDAVALTPPPMARAQAAAQRSAASELTRLFRTHAISPTLYRRYRAILQAAIAANQRLQGTTRGYELGSVLANVHAIAAAGLLSASRAPALFLTLDANRRWWTTGPLLSSGARVELAGSQLVWEYYPGQGIELQQLGSFGKANGMFTARDYKDLRTLLGELIPLAVKRAGGLVWEYYFSFDGGYPPWTSAMSQGTALEALSRGFRAFHDASYLSTGRQALPVFAAAPPGGVRLRTPEGNQYLQYSFAPGVSIINAFLQSLIGLYDFAKVSHDARAMALFRAGDATARTELPSFDTGAWSLYQPGLEDSLDYHELVTGFVHELCDRTHAAVYCTTAQHFDAYLTTPPALRLLTHRTHRFQATTIRFDLSKASHVGIVMLRNGQILFETSADFTYGVNSFAVPAPGHTGTYTIRLAATDLAGNFNRIVGTLAVS
jgi:D-glucuronyl C5-epimerase C-terminus